MLSTIQSFQSIARLRVAGGAFIGDDSELNTGNFFWYSMDDADNTGSNPDDLSSAGNNGTNNGATTGQTGDTGESYGFDGVNDYVDSGVAPSASDTEITLYVKFQLKSTGGANKMLIAFQDTSFAKYCTIRYTASVTRLDFEVQNSDSEYDVVTYVIPSVNTTDWYEAVLKVSGSSDSGEMKAFFGISGSLAQVGSTQARTTNGNFSSANNIIIGRNSVNTGNPADVYIDQSGAWNKYISDSKITDVLSGNTWD